MAFRRKFLVFNKFRLIGIHFKRKKKSNTKNPENIPTTRNPAQMVPKNQKNGFSVSLSLTIEIRTTLPRKRDLTKLMCYWDIGWGQSESWSKRANGKLLSLEEQLVARSHCHGNHCPDPRRSQSRWWELCWWLWACTYLHMLIRTSPADGIIAGRSWDDFAVSG